MTGGWGGNGGLGEGGLGDRGSNRAGGELVGRESEHDRGQLQEVQVKLSAATAGSDPMLELLLLLLACVQILGDTPTPEDIQTGRVTPMFFGSAFNNFGVDLFLQAFIGMAVAPGPAIARGNPAVLQPLTPEQLQERQAAAETASTSSSSSSNGASRTSSSSRSSSSGKKGAAGAKGGSTGSSSVDGVVPPDSQHFSGLVFKLQANMDPKHRDKVGGEDHLCGHACPGALLLTSHHTTSFHMERLGCGCVVLPREKTVIAGLSAWCAAANPVPAPVLLLTVARATQQAGAGHFTLC